MCPRPSNALFILFATSAFVTLSLCGVGLLTPPNPLLMLSTIGGACVTVLSGIASLVEDIMFDIKNMLQKNV